MGVELKEWQKVAIAFAITYIALFAAQALLSGNSIISAWANNPTFYLIPIVGFFFAYFAVGWIEDYFELKDGQDYAGYWKFFHPKNKQTRTLQFLIIVIILGLLAWFVAISFYMQNNVSLELRSNQQYIDGQELQFSQACKINALEGNSKRNAFFDSFGVSNCLAGGMFVDQLKASPYLIFIIAIIFGIGAFLLINFKNHEGKEFAKELISIIISAIIAIVIALVLYLALKSSILGDTIVEILGIILFLVIYTQIYNRIEKLF
ncbi:MAG: hypothetical protein Q7R70_01905 [Candidatus Diapherotrites archaeon]|nr:hypothetical protein [Candidatus Diapherotrites archaeon]